jgi:hypothetical protein
MNRITFGFILWIACAVFFVIYGILAFFAKKPFGFWANGKNPVRIADVSGYNNALGKLWIAYGVCLGLLGIPVMTSESRTLIVITVIATAVLTIGMVVVYVIRIEEKYKVK